MPISTKDGLRPWQHAVVFLLACAIIVSRRPDALFHPQFWAEDGIVWFANAYNLGWWHALFRTEVGYFQTLPRLSAALALLVPLAYAPLVTNLIALAVQALPVNLLLATRSHEWGTLRTRAAFAFIYLALPNCPEISANITNAQWALAFSTLLILVAAPASSIYIRTFDLMVILLCGLTGPFCLFLILVAVFLRWKRRGRSPQVLIIILSLCCIIQAYGLLVLGTTQRSSANLGASLSGFIRILAGHIYIGALVGPTHAALASGTRNFLILLAVALAGTALIVFAFRHAPLPMRTFAGFATFILAAELASPSSYDAFNTPKWQLIARASAIRYWFFPSLLFLWSLVLGVVRGTQALKIACASVLILLCFGVAVCWRRPPFADTHFLELTKTFEASPPGTTIVFPENPEGWTFQLVKHATH
jgi:hypothetical protein